MFNYNLGNLLVYLKADSMQFNEMIQGAQRRIEETSKHLTSMGKKMTYAITLPLVGLGATMIKFASDAEEIDSKFRVTFSNVTKDAVNAMNILDKAYGLNTTQAKEMLSATGDLLTGFGFTQNASLDLSMQIQRLAVDLASFQNLEGGTKRASEALTKALLGERESAKLLGIVIREEDVKKRILLNTNEGIVYSNENIAKAYATMQIAMEQSKNAIGDYERTNKSFANQWRELKADLYDVFIAFGEILIPYVKMAIEKVREFILDIKNLDEETKGFYLTLGGFALVIGPVILAVGILGKTFAFVTGILTLHNIQLAIAVGTYTLIAIGIAVVADALLQLFGIADLGVIDFMNNIKIAGSSIQAWITTAFLMIYQKWDWVKMQIVGGWVTIKEAVLEVKDIIIEQITKMAQTISNVFWKAIEIISGMIAKLGKVAVKAASWVGLIDKQEAENYIRTIEDIQNRVKDKQEENNRVYQDIIDSTLSKAEDRYKEYLDTIMNLEEKHKNKIEEIKDAIANVFSEDSKQKSWFEKIGESIKKAFSLPTWNLEEWDPNSFKVKTPEVSTPEMEVAMKAAKAETQFQETSKRITYKSIMDDNMIGKKSTQKIESDQLEEIIYVLKDISGHQPSLEDYIPKVWGLSG